MLRSAFGFFVAAAFLVGCVRAPIEVVRDASPESAGKPEIEIGPPITSGNLTVFPIVSTKARMDDLYITLDEGMAAGTVEIREGGGEEESDGEEFGELVESTATDPLPGSNETQEHSIPESEEPSNNDEQNADDSDPSEQTVETLFVTNADKKPLYLMPGEIVLGGDQDRMIAEECIVPPGSKAFAISVYCVEQGRWENRSPDRTVAELSVAMQSLADLQNDEGRTIQNFPPNLTLLITQATEIEQGKFVGGLGAATNSVRKAAQIDKDQHKVWENVIRENEQGDVKTDSDAFTANYCQPENVQRLLPYIAALDEPVSETTNVVGAIVVINGKIESSDVFNSTPLFRKLWPKLLKGFALQAANTPVDDIDACVSIEDAREFLEKSINAQLAEKDETKSVVIERRESDGLICISSRTKQFADQVNSPSACLGGDGVGFGGGGFGGGGVGGGGFFGGGVHSSSFPTSSK